MENVQQKEKVQIVKSVLAAQVEAGMKRDALCEHYGLKPAQMAQVLKQAGLKIRKFHTPVFELIDEEVAVEEKVDPVTDPNVDYNHIDVVEAEQVVAETVTEQTQAFEASEPVIPTEELWK